MKSNKTIQLGHGSGGLLSNQLIDKTILKYFKNKTLRKLEDAAEISMTGTRLAFTTDSYVINPLFFPGGDIGKLAICGTVNDLAMKGSIPYYISFSLIIEEGFSFSALERILKSAARTARQARVQVVCGDTKVVEKGKADGLFITTSGVGIIKIPVDKGKIRSGDKIIISGTIADHGITIMNERLQLHMRSKLKSDCAPISLITNRLFSFKKTLHYMRDPTRGGIAGVLNEIIKETPFGIILNEEDIPLKREVIGISDILGVDPLYIANEGKFIAIVDNRTAVRILKRTKSHRLGRDAAIIGKVVEKPTGVWLKTKIGGIHPLLQLESEGLPRIC